MALSLEGPFLDDEDMCTTWLKAHIRRQDSSLLNHVQPKLKDHQELSQKLCEQSFSGDLGLLISLAELDHDHRHLVMAFSLQSHSWLIKGVRAKM